MDVSFIKDSVAVGCLGLPIVKPKSAAATRGEGINLLDVRPLISNVKYFLGRRRKLLRDAERFDTGRAGLRKRPEYIWASGIA
jgi:hypothetical protein